MLHMSAEVKADHMAVFEKQAAGQFVVDVLFYIHLDIELLRKASR